MGLTQADIYDLLENNSTVYLTGYSTESKLTRFAVHFGSKGLYFLTSSEDFCYLKRTVNIMEEFSKQYKYCCLISSLESITSTFYDIKQDESLTLFDLVQV